MNLTRRFIWIFCCCCLVVSHLFSCFFVFIFTIFHYCFCLAQSLFCCCCFCGFCILTIFFKCFSHSSWGTLERTTLRMFETLSLENFKLFKNLFFQKFLLFLIIAWINDQLTDCVSEWLNDQLSNWVNEDNLMMGYWSQAIKCATTS